MLERFAAIRQHSRGGAVAPNKPLTLLWALERVAGGKPRLTPFAEAEEELQPLLDRVGHAQLEVSPELCGEAARLLEQQLAPSRAARSRQAAEPVWETVRRLAREACFRREVLAAYNERCVVCDWRCVVGGSPVALDAAHVRPHAKKGPDSLDNGVPYCSLHHRLFDAGLFGWDEARRLIVSPQWRGGLSGLMPSLGDFAGKELPDPRPGVPRVSGHHLAWHRGHVFRR
jgi:putative restriction endonuclease